jgi:hypothetical protein
VNLIGASVDGVLVGGSPKVQELKVVNYFDPGRVLVRPPLFMNVQVKFAWYLDRERASMSGCGRAMVKYRMSRS